MHLTGFLALPGVEQGEIGQIGFQTLKNWISGFSGPKPEIGKILSIPGLEPGSQNSEPDTQPLH